MEDHRGRTVLTLDIRKAGDLLGENVLMEDGDVPGRATCLGPTVTCGIDRRTFESLVTRYPAVGLVVIRNLSRRIDHLSGKLGALSEPIWMTDSTKSSPTLRGTWVRPPRGGGPSLSSDSRGDRFPRRRSPGERYPRPRQLRDTGRVRTAGKFLFVRDTV